MLITCNRRVLTVKCEVDNIGMLYSSLTRNVVAIYHAPIRTNFRPVQVLTKSASWLPCGTQPCTIATATAWLNDTHTCSCCVFPKLVASRVLMYGLFCLSKAIASQASDMKTGVMACLVTLRTRIQKCCQCTGTLPYHSQRVRIAPADRHVVRRRFTQC